MVKQKRTASTGNRIIGRIVVEVLKLLMGEITKGAIYIHTVYNYAALIHEPNEADYRLGVYGSYRVSGRIMTLVS